MSKTFIELVRQGEPDDIAKAVEERPELVACRDAQEVSALLWSVYTGRPQVRKFLLAHLKEQHKPLNIFEAAACGDCERLHLLIAEDAALARAVSGDGWTPLHLASAFADASTVRLLLEHGAHVHQRSHNPLRNQPLHACIALGKSAEVVALLIDCGADVNATQSSGFAPLHQAAANGSAEIVQLLLKAGANPKARCDKSKTPADYARDRGHTELAARLDSL